MGEAAEDELDRAETYGDDCLCELSDPWRCAVARHLSTLICHCGCHRDRVRADQPQEGKP